MAIYRGPGGANDGIPAASSTEFPGDVNVAGNLHVNGDITSDGNIDGVHTGDGSQLTGLITELPTLAELGIPNHDKLTVDELGNVTVANDITVDGVLYGDGSGLTNIPTSELPDVYTKDEIDAQQNAQDVNITANTNAIANLPSPVDTYTKAEINASQDAQDVEIAKKANTSDVYTKEATDTLLDSKANVGDSYTKAETYNTTEIDGKLSQKADKDNTYTKEEVDNLIEGASGAIVGNYTNKWASNVARDPGAGNLYLVAGMDFTMKFEDATRIYISNTDGDGALRDFDKVKVDDVLTVTSDNGQGVFKLLSISDLTGYRELVLEAESATGTVANDTPVSIVLDVASSSGGGSGTGGSLPKGSIIMWSIPEVPEGWQICDGTNDTPDLRDKFVVGAGTTYDLDAEGGSKDAVVVSHTHSAPTTVPIQGPGGNQGKTGFDYIGGGNTVTNKNINANGVSGVDKNLPPYYSLYYIMKMVEGGGSGGSGIEEAPVDGKQYARQDGDWTEVEASSGGGGPTPTPEDLVWEHKSGERDFDVVYTNTNDVPIYVYINTTTNSANEYCNMWIDGTNFNALGQGSGGGARLYAGNLFVIPSGSTYELRATDKGTLNLSNWKEARMPLAIANPSVETAIGMVAPFAMDSVPTGWLHCDGSEVSRDTYSLLYSKVGDTYGNGDGSTTFNLPDLQDEFIRGSSDTLPVGNKQDDEFKEHTHLGGAGGANGGGSYGSLSGSTKIPTSSEGGEETRPRNVAMLYCINATAEETTRAVTPETGTTEVYGTAKAMAKIIDSEITGTEAVPTMDGVYNGLGIKGIGKITTGKYFIDFEDGLFEDDKYITTGIVTYPTSGLGATALLRDDRIATSTKNRLYFATITSTGYGNAFESEITVFDNKPVLVSGGSGGGEVTEKEAVVVMAKNSADQVISKQVWTQVNLDNVEYDTSNSFSGGEFKPSVAGYYQISAVLNSSGSAIPVQTALCRVLKNGDHALASTNLNMRGGEDDHITSNISGIVYLDGVNDSITLEAYINSSSPKVEKEITFLSAHLITGQSTGGGSGEATGTPTSFARIVDEKPQGTHGGSSVVGMQDRTLNKIEYDKDSIVTLADDKEFTLQKGTYVIDFSTSVYNTTNTSVFLYSVTDDKNVGFGISSHVVGSASVDGSKVLDGSYFVTLTEPHTYKVCLNASTATAGYGLGFNSTSGPSIFTTVDIQKVGTGGVSSGSETGTSSSFARIVDEKPQGTYGGTNVAGIQQRTLNKIEYDDDNIVTLSEDLNFTLQAGTYVIDFKAPASSGVNYHNCFLHSVTDNVKVSQGGIAYLATDVDWSSGKYYVTLTEPHTYQVQHYMEKAVTYGLGYTSKSGPTILTQVDIQKLGTGGASSGGGSYTPEAMVWEDKLAERAWATDYVNPYDVPLYLQIGASSTHAEACTWYVTIDGITMGTSGKHSGTPHAYNTSLFIVPAGGTYRVDKTRTNTFTAWNEAKMPVAVGTGGKTAQVLANLPATISSPLDEWIKLPLESDDEGFDNSTHRYKPTVAGWYSFQGQVSGLGINTGISCKIVRNFDSGTYDPDKDEFVGLSTSSDSTHPARSVNALFYLNGKDDYVELQGYNKQTAGYQGSPSNLTCLQGFLISAGASSGGGGTPATYVTFDGTTTPPTIKGSNNVSSVDRNSTGDYTINFATPMSDSDYAVSLSNVTTSASINTVHAKIKGTTTGGADLKTPTQLTIKTAGSSSSVDMSLVSVAIIDKNSSSGGGSGSSIWSDVDGDAVLETDGKKLTIDANVAELGAKARISTDTNLLEFNVGSGGLPDMIVNDGFVKLQRDGQEININPSYSDTGNAIIESNDPIGLMSGSKLGLLVRTDGVVTLPNIPAGAASGGPNLYAGSDGVIHTLSTRYYNTEEVDKKLAIKDKLIEKLSARLDELDKRVNNGGGK